jgi:hypothetical protein
MCASPLNALFYGHRTMLKELLEYVGSNNRVCPQPQKWDELWKLLPDRKRVGGGWDPPLPLILAAWWHTSAL